MYGSQIALGVAVLLNLVSPALGLSVNRPVAMPAHLHAINLGPGTAQNSGSCRRMPQHPTRLITESRDPLDVQLSDRFELSRGPLSENRNQKLPCTFNEPNISR